jgi:uncharacterized RDD family membrane protein YckC
MGQSSLSLDDMELPESVCRVGQVPSNWKQGIMQQGKSGLCATRRIFGVLGAKEWRFMDESTGSLGAIYEKTAYAGFTKRVIIAMVDLFVLMLVELLVLYFSGHLIYSESYYFRFNSVAFVFLSILYLAIIKRSKFGTVGYMLTGVKIVDLKGQRPSIFKMTLRTSLLLIGPFELIFDILWLTSEATRQTLRDKYVGTYVVRKEATPRLYGKLRNVTLGVMGWSLMYREVEEGKVQ